MALFRTPEDGEPVLIIPPGLGDERVTTGTLSKLQVEDAQTQSFIASLEIAGGSRSEIVVEEGSDPPDRFISLGQERQGLELTVLTITNMRADLARAREFGRQLTSILSARAEFDHLKGRIVSITSDGGPNDSLAWGRARRALAETAELLKVDLGYLGQGAVLNADGSIPAAIPLRGVYGQVGSLHVYVNGWGLPDAISVAAFPQAEFTLTEARAMVSRCIREKDVEANDHLLISLGAPDQHGYICPPDHFLFEFLRDHGIGTVAKPRHLKAIYLHLWGNPGDTHVIYGPPNDSALASALLNGVGRLP